MISPNDLNVLGKPTFLLPRDIIATVLDITVTAWSFVLARKEVNNATLETDIAGHLGKAMLEEKNQRPTLKQQFRIEEEVGTRSSLNTPKPEGRIDIKIIYSFDEGEYFGLECKRISGTDRALARKYVTQGLMRFIDGKYSPGHDWAAMLGFVIDGDLAGCVQLVHKGLVQTRRATNMNGDWIIESSFGPYKGLYSSRHRQANRKSIISVLHLFLTVS